MPPPDIPDYSHVPIVNPETIPDLIRCCSPELKETLTRLIWHLVRDAQCLPVEFRLAP